MTLGDYNHPLSILVFFRQIYYFTGNVLQIGCSKVLLLRKCQGLCFVTENDVDVQQSFHQFLGKSFTNERSAEVCYKHFVFSRGMFPDLVSSIGTHGEKKTLRMNKFSNTTSSSVKTEKK